MFRAWSLSISRNKSHASISLFLLLFALPVLAEEVPSEVVTLQNAAEQDLLNNNCEAAMEKYQQIISHYPNTPYSALAQCNLAIAHIKLGEYTEAQASTEKFFSNYPYDQGTGKKVRQIAYAYFKANQFSTAKALCQTAISSWPNDSKTILIKRDLVINNIRLGGYDEAAALTNQLILDHEEEKLSRLFQSGLILFLRRFPFRLHIFHH